MADLTPTAQWVGTYQIETTDLVQGGAGGIANDPHQDLVDRTEYIYDTFYAAGTPLVTPVDIQIAGDTNANMLYIDVSADVIGFGKAPTTGHTVEIQNKTTSGKNLRLAANLGTPVDGGEIVMADKSNVDAFNVNITNLGSFSIYDVVATSHQLVIDNTGLFEFNQDNRTTADFKVHGTTDNLIHGDAGQDNIGIGTGSPTSTKKVDLTTSFKWGSYNVTSSTTADSAAVYGENTGASGAVYGGYFKASSTTTASAAVYGTQAGASGLVYGIYGTVVSTTSNAAGVYGENTGASGATLGVRGVATASSSGVGVLGQGDQAGVWGNTSATSGTGVRGEKLGSSAGHGAYFTTASTDASSAGCRADGVGAGSHDFLALNGEYDSVSDKSLKIGKQDVDILGAIRNYSNWHIQKYSYKFCDKNRELITPYADEFQEAFELTDCSDNEHLNTTVIAGTAFGGVVQLVDEIDRLKERIKELEESK
jgi:hypothetical protein